MRIALTNQTQNVRAGETVRNSDEDKYCFNLIDNYLSFTLDSEVYRRGLRFKIHSLKLRVKIFGQFDRKDSEGPGDKHFHTRLQIIFAVGWHYRKVISHMGCDDMSVL